MKKLKKLIIVSVFGLFLANFANAQELGLRFGDTFGNNVAIDGIFSLGEFNRIHGDVNFGGNGVGVELLWDFLYRPLGQEAFNWYVGAGPSLFLGDPFLMGISGEIGIEYHFAGAPIALGLDWRPTIIIIDDDLADYTGFQGGWFGLNVRYVFGQ